MTMPPHAFLTVSPVPSRFYEGETSTIIAALSQTLSDDVTVTIGVDEAHVNHTATADDYTLSGNLTLTIPAGEMRGTGAPRLRPRTTSTSGRHRDRSSSTSRR